MKLIWRPLDLILVLLLLVAMAFTVLRGLVRPEVYYTPSICFKPTFRSFIMSTGGDGLSIRGLQPLPSTL